MLTLASDFLFGATGLHRWQHHTFHHLSDDAITQYHGRVAITECQGESQVYEVGHFLYRRRGKYDHVVVAIASSTRCLEIVTLRRLDGSQS